MVHMTTRHIKFSLYKCVKPPYRVVTIPKEENYINLNPKLVSIFQFPKISEVSIETKSSTSWVENTILKKVQNTRSPILFQISTLINVHNLINKCPKTLCYS